MSAKHHATQPRRQRSTSDLERRVRHLERHFKRDAASIATSVARVEVGDALRAHVEEKHGPFWKRSD